MYAIGIDLGGTFIAGGIADGDGRLLCRRSVPTGAERGPEEIVRDMAGMCRGMAAELGVGCEDMEYIGIAAPGAVDPGRGMILRAENIHFKDYPICRALYRAIGEKAPVYIENDANAAAVAEHFAGAAKGTENSVLITLGTGIGGGVIIRGRLYSGFNYAGAEVGHTVIVKDGALCTCGRRGCWEAYCAAPGLVRLTREEILRRRSAGETTLMEKLTGGDLNNVTARTAFDAGRMGDRAAVCVTEEYADFLALGIANLINIFQPEVLALGGGISNEGEYLLELIDDKVFSQVFTKRTVPKCDLRIARFKNDAGIIGAAMLGRERAD